jgi:4-hydroxy-2,2'-bipyrrole-5-carbaldehyde O-methyltransferase
MNLRYTLSFLGIMKIPGLYPVLKDWQSFVRMHFLFAAYESGLLNALVTPRKKSMLIKELDVKRPELLDALLDVGLATKELELKNEFFYVKGKRSKAILSSNGDMLAAMIQANVTYYSDVYRNAAYRIHGSELGEEAKLYYPNRVHSLFKMLQLTGLTIIFWNEHLSAALIEIKRSLRIK